MRRYLLILAIAVLAAGMPASAEMCTVDDVPAATLLLPYFEVDLDAAPGAGVNTVFTIHNALPSPTLAHVTLWTDWSQPTISFDIFLTGYDVQAVDLYELFVNGNLPVTADEQSDQGQDGGRIADPTSSCDATVDSCSPHGSNPSWDGSFVGGGFGAVNCIDIFPFFVNPLLFTALLESTQARHTGQPVDGGCFGADHGDNVARGYVTVDNTSACNLLFPGDPGYFGDGVDPGIASNVNQLWGDWYFVDPTNPSTLPVDALVHIEADEAFDSGSTPTGRTFYGRYTQASGGFDHREPLATSWSFSFNQGPGLVTDVVAWRDSNSDDQSSSGYPCGSGPGTGPSWHPLNQNQVVCFNQTEGALEICTDADCLPLETQRLALGTGAFDVPFNAGWCRLDLNIAGPPISRPGRPPAPPAPPEAAQSWVGATFHGGTVVAGGLSAVAISTACDEPAATIAINLFAAGFETGDTSEWSATIP